ncbi:MAG: cytidine/deoxycytidylate deaminase family protein [Oscillospiraceae bacterium]|nr:cytidine/deoxycytidylate deaminase family protein [Oscillospiraceae bacterium]
MERTDKANYYLNIADTVSERSTCLRRRYGAIVVLNDEIISTGYNGAPRGRKNCVDIGSCTREKLGIPSGERYELCRSVHAEANALLSAPRRDCIGGILYLSGRNVADGSLVTATPCSMCRRLIINMGIRQVVARTEDGGFTVTEVRDWVFNDDSFDVMP